MTDAAELVEENDVMVPMRDGIRLRTDVFRPATGGPHPVLVQRYPYSPRDGFGAMFGRMIAAQGYAVVVQSCRGRFGSEGDFYPITLTSRTATTPSSGPPPSRGRTARSGCMAPPMAA